MPGTSALGKRTPANRPDDARYRTVTTPTGITGVKAYDTVRGVYNLKRSNTRKLRSKLADAATGGYCRITCLGDSTTAGETAVGGTTPYPMQLRSILSAFLGLPVAGTGHVPTYAGLTPTDPRWAFTAGWISFGSGQDFRKSTTLGSVATFTSDLPGTIVEVATLGTSPALSIAIDGGAPVTYTPPVSSAVQKYTVTGLANTTHTVTVTTTTATESYVCSVDVRQASGLLVNNFGAGSFRANDWNAGTQYYSIYPVTQNITTPDVAVLILGENDDSQSIDPALTQSSLAGLVGKLQAYGADVIMGTTIPFSGQRDVYRQAAYAVADATDVPLVDLVDRMGSYTQQQAIGHMTNTLHPNSKGYREMAQGIAAAFLLAA